MSRKLRKVGKWLLLIVVSLCVMGFLLLCFERVRGAVSLSSYKQKLARRGEAVSAQDLARSVPQGSNGVAEVLHACRELVEGEVMPEHYPPGMTMTRSGRAIAGFRQHQWTEDKLVYDWNRLDRDLETNRAVLKRIRTALGQPVLDHQLDYSQGPKMPLPHLVRPKELARWFGAQSSLALHEHRLQEAVDPLIAEICLPRFLERDGILISELVRIAIASLARADTWAALQANGWTDEQLAGIQKAWEAQRFLTNFTRGLEGERIYCTSAFELCRASQAETASMLFWMDDMNFMDLADRPAWEKAVRALPAGDALAEFLKEDLYCRVWRFAWLDQCERRYLEAVQGLIEISRRMEATADLVTAEKSIQALLERIENRTVYDSLRFGFGVTSVATLSRGISKAARAETERSLVLAAIALKRYGLSNTNPPASLQHLVPAFLSSVPIDYMNGNPIQYRVKPDESVALYSVGEDGKDDGGDAGLLDASKQWTMWHRRDVVWPTLALPEELEPDELPDAEVIVQASANAATVRSNPPLRVLILSGQNNHNWRETTPRLRMILESEGRFTVEISEQPEHLTNVALEPYDVLLSNWNTFDNPAVTNWPAAAREAFLAFVRNGKGLVIVHAGSSSFYDWPEYHQLAGAAWKLGQTGHGARHQFTVHALDPAHPITRGMTNFTTFDELWHNAGLQAGVHILATAFSDPASGGSGENEPVALVTEFGRGRCFTLLLGHDAKAMDSSGFQSLLRRGVEWAATEKVAAPLQTEAR